MMCFDGELDDARCRDVLALASTDTGRRSKLAALRIVSDVLRDQANAGPGGDIADLVMARIAREDHEPPSSTGSPESGTGSPESGEPSGRVPVHSPAANDNARGIFALAAIAVAAAAGMMLWGRMDPEVTPPDGPPPIAAVAPPSEPAVVEVAPPVQEEASPDGEDEHGVEVAAVDFGTRTGTIFYIPADAASSKHTTTVVWLADDLVGGK
jgi:hypothetical protein